MSLEIFDSQNSSFSNNSFTFLLYKLRIYEIRKRLNFSNPYSLQFWTSFAFDVWFSLINDKLN